MPANSNFGLSVTERLSPSPAPLERALRKLSNSLRVAMPGVIIAFDADKQTVVVQMTTDENVSYLDAGDAGWQTVKTQIQIPILQDIPIVIPRAGKFSLTLPITAGDEVLVIFADMCIDSWWQSGGTSNHQMDIRRHDLSDGFAVLAPWSQPRRIQNYSTTSAQLRSEDGQTVIDVADNQITLTAQNVQVNASSTATIQGQNVNITGSSSVTITGDSGVTIDGNNTTKVDGKTFVLHEHSGGTISGSTGPVE